MITTKLEQKIEEQSRLMKELKHSSFMYNQLWKDQERLSLVCYSISNGVWPRSEVHVCLRNSNDERRVFKFSKEQFKDCPLFGVKINLTNKHLFPEVNIETYFVRD